MSEDPRLQRADLARVIERASVIDDEVQGLGAEEVIEIAQELGISDDAVRRALAEVDLERPSRGWSLWKEVSAFGALGVALAWVNQFLWGVGGVFGWTPSGQSLTLSVFIATLMVRALLPDRDRPHARFQADSLLAWLSIMATTMFLRAGDFYTITEFAADLLRILPRYAGPSALAGALIVEFRRRWPRHPLSPARPEASKAPSRSLLRWIKGWFGSLRLPTPTPVPLTKAAVGSKPTIR